MKKYTIKKGKHDSGLHFGITFKNKIEILAKFDANCLYDLGTNDNYDINKLFGFSTEYNHQKQSARIGWRCLDGENIEILTYTYNNSVRTTETVLGRVKPGQEFECSIEDIETDYIYFFKGNGYTVKVRDAKQKDTVLFKYLLYPYFGGNIPAPNNMTMYVDHK